MDNEQWQQLIEKARQQYLKEQRDYREITWLLLKNGAEAAGCLLEAQEWHNSWDYWGSSLQFEDALDTLEIKGCELADITSLLEQFASQSDNS